MILESFSVVQNSLNASAYCALHKVVGFYNYQAKDVTIALSNDLVDFSIWVQGQAVAMVRLVGDNRIVFFIKDLIVHPDYQHLGLGDLMMQSVLGYIKTHGCEHAYVGLMSTPGRESFYEQYGFIRRPCDRLGSGMVMFNET